MQSRIDIRTSAFTDVVPFFPQCRRHWKRKWIGIGSQSLSPCTHVHAYTLMYVYASSAIPGDHSQPSRLHWRAAAFPRPFSFDTPRLSRRPRKRKETGTVAFEEWADLGKGCIYACVLPLENAAVGSFKPLYCEEKAAWEDGVNWSQTETLVALHSSIAFANAIAYFVLHLSRYSGYIFPNISWPEGLTIEEVCGVMQVQLLLCFK